METARLAWARFGAFVARLCSRIPRLTRDDTVFVGGAFWISRAVISLCRRAAAARLTILIHDLIPITHPEFTGEDFTPEYREILGLAAHFIVTTEFNHHALIKVRRDMGLEATSVSVVPLAHEFPGAARNDKPLRPSSRFQSLANLDFVLCIGTVEIRKNHMMLFSVWDALSAEFGDRLPPLVAGRRGWKARAALARLDEFLDPGRIIFAEAPTDEELRWLYSSCLFTIFPSYFEGWGLPVGECLKFGRACAASDTSSIPAVCGDLCLYFSPYHGSTIRDVVIRLLDPHFRRSCQQKIAEASLRSWNDVAADIEKVILEQELALYVVAGKMDAGTDSLQRLTSRSTVQEPDTAAGPIFVRIIRDGDDPAAFAPRLPEKRAS